MEKRIYGCDKCKKETTRFNHLFNKPDDWKEVTIKWGQYNETRMLLCDECCEKLEIPIMKPANDSLTPKTVLDTEGTAQRLYDIIAEIIEENKG